MLQSKFNILDIHIEEEINVGFGLDKSYTGIFFSIEFHYSECGWYTDDDDDDDDWIWKKVKKKKHTNQNENFIF